jgi:glucose-6-phosphate isomerase
VNAAMLKLFAALEERRGAVQSVPLRQRFAEDPERFARFSIAFGDFLLDYSKNLIDETVMANLIELAEAAEVEKYRARMFSGEPINVTEDRPALHVALRAAPEDVYRVAGQNVVPEVQSVLARMSDFSVGVRSGVIAGAEGQFTDVVNIGIGGSDLGPAMATRALKPWQDGPRMHFVSNVDGAHIRDTIGELNPGTTLFLIASKTFSTVETMTNARTARQWIVEAVGEKKVPAHFAAISSAVGRAADFGIGPERIFGFWDWVGGRYSIWSAVGLPLMIAIGPESFREFLTGGRTMDDHFRTAPIGQNMPVVLAMLGVWYRNVVGFPSYAVIPYDQRLDRLPAYLQQLDMESSGKRVRTGGNAVRGPTGPIVFGEPGTNAQHAFFQLLHQGTDPVPVDFLVAVLSDAGYDEHQQLLLANCLAQSEALMRGRTLAEAREELVAAGLGPRAVDKLAPHKVSPGNRPSNTILYRRLDPYTLGLIVALYEHKVFVQGIVWGIDSFDQWGVELGKELAGRLLRPVQGFDDEALRDSSTAGLISAIRSFRAG